MRSSGATGQGFRRRDQGRGAPWHGSEGLAGAPGASHPGRRALAGLRRLAAVAWVAAAGLSTPGVQAAAFDFNDSSWEGTSELLALARAQLGKQRVKLVAQIPWGEVTPSDAILALHPERAMDYREVAAFLAAGGRLGVADDHGKGDLLLTRFRIRRVQAPLRPLAPLRDNPNLPIAVPSVSPDEQPHTLVEGVDRVVTNHPTGLSTEGGLRLTPILELPASGEASVVLALVGVIGDARRCGLAARAGPDEGPGSPAPAGRCGRLFALSDPSAVMNAMLRYPGNRRFAERLVEYLVGDDTWGPRGGSLYLVANDFTEAGSFGDRGGLAGALESKLEALTRLVSETRRGGLPGPLTVLLAALAVGGAVFWTLTAAGRRYRPSSPRYARETPLVAQGGIAGRAAVLSAETTHPALAVLELKAALEESLRERLGLPPLTDLGRIQEEIRGRSALGQRNSAELSLLLREMSAAEAAVLRTERIRIPEARVRKMHEAVDGILSELDERLGKPK
jgi:hypothetical protein